MWDKRLQALGRARQRFCFGNQRLERGRALVLIAEPGITNSSQLRHHHVALFAASRSIASRVFRISAATSASARSSGVSFTSFAPRIFE